MNNRMSSKVVLRISELYEILVSVICLFLSFVVRRKDHNIAFGSWCGELYIDNSRYLAEYISIHHPEYRIFWVGKESIRDQVPSSFEFVRLNSISSVLRLLSCRTFFFTQMHRPDICRFNVYRGAILCFLDHGNIIKKSAMDDPSYDGRLEYRNFNNFKKLYTDIIGENYPYRYITVSSDKTALTYKTALAYRMDTKTRLIKTGLPRNDMLFIREGVEEDKHKYAHLLGFDPKKRIILYVPTFRRKTEKIESFARRDIAEIERMETILNRNNAVLLEKNHFASDRYSVNRTSAGSPSIIKIDKPVNVQELLRFSDVLISDYSGVILDYLLLDRPIMYYIYDYDDYKNNDSGLYYDIEAYGAGIVARSFEEICYGLEQILEKKIDDSAGKRKVVANELCTYDDGHSSEKVYNMVLWYHHDVAERIGE